MDVSLIIVNYNTKDLISNCLSSIFKQTVGLQFEVIVVDNASVDGSRQVIIETFPQVILIQNKVNLGFGRANNLGVEKASGKYLFFLNSDTVLLNNAISIFFNFSEHNETNLKIGVIGGILMDSSKSETRSFGPLPTKTEILRSLLGLCSGFPRMKSGEAIIFKKNGFLEVEYVTGADMFIQKSIFEAFVGFDPEFFMYYEETDLQLRLKNAGYHNFVISGIQIIHYESASFDRRKTNNTKRIIITKSTFHYFRKHSNYLPYLIFKILYLAFRLPTIFYLSYSFKEKKEYFLQIINS